MSPESSGERTESATPKRRRDSRERGQVLKSTEIISAVSVLSLFGFLYLTFGLFVGRASGFIAKHLSEGYLANRTEEYTTALIQKVFLDAVIDLAVMAFPLFFVALIVGTAANVAQVGFLFTTKTLMPTLSRISPIQGFKRLFSTRSLAELTKSLIKLAILGFLVYNDYIKHMQNFPRMMYMQIAQSFPGLMRICFGIGLKMGAALLVIAVFDYIYQWWRHEKDMKMTKQEVKEEYKQLEGSPEIRSRIRQKQRQVSAARMMREMPTADVVITNPTHFAVALRYKEKQDKAPVVVAKGADYLAEKIKQTAKEHRIEVVENRELARTLYFTCEIGGEISEELYQAVAEVLVYVYGLKNHTRKQST